MTRFNPVTFKAIAGCCGQDSIWDSCSFIVWALTVTPKYFTVINSGNDLQIQKLAQMNNSESD
jgi:hypothetical protein